MPIVSTKRIGFILSSYHNKRKKLGKRLSLMQTIRRKTRTKFVSIKSIKVLQGVHGAHQVKEYHFPSRAIDGSAD